MFVNCLRITQPFGTGKILNIKEYNIIVRKLIATHVGQNVRMEMFKSDDVITDLINELAYADSTFDGRGTIEGYRAFRFGCYVRKYLKKRKQHCCRVQSFIIESDLIDDGINYERLADNKEHIEHILGQLSPFYAKILRSKYIEGRTLREIGQQQGLSYETIRTALKKAKELCRLISN